MKNLIPTTTYYYLHFKHENIGLGGFQKLVRKFTRVQLMKMISAPVSLPIQVRVLHLHSVGTKEILAILVSPLQHQLAREHHELTFTKWLPSKERDSEFTYMNIYVPPWDDPTPGTAPENDSNGLSDFFRKGSESTSFLFHRRHRFST